MFWTILGILFLTAVYIVSNFQAKGPKSIFEELTEWQRMKYFLRNNKRYYHLFEKIDILEKSEFSAGDGIPMHKDILMTAFRDMQYQNKIREEFVEDFDKLITKIETIINILFERAQTFANKKDQTILKQFDYILGKLDRVAIEQTEITENMYKLLGYQSGLIDVENENDEEEDIPF